MSTNLQKSLVLDGIAASEAIDSSGEILDIKGLDITNLQEGSGVLNYEHRGDQSHGASANDVIGHITFAKKIFGADDCDNDRQRLYWDKIKLPFVYIQAELFDGEGHPGAQAAAALMRYYQRRNLPILARFSIEGSTLERKGNRLVRAIAKRVAYTLKPCNRSCISGIVSDSATPAVPKGDALKELIRHEDPNRKLLGAFDGEAGIVADSIEADEPDETNALAKALSIGGGDVAPTSLSGGAALQAESMDVQKRKKFLKNQALAAVRDWRGRGDLKKFLKHRLPDTSEEFINHFAKLVEDYHLRKTINLEDNLAKAVAGKTREGHMAFKNKPPEGAAAPATNTVAPAPSPATPTASATPPPTTPSPVKQVKPADRRLTIRGRKIQPITTLGHTHFDENKGVLYTPRGSFRMYLPQNDKTPGALEAYHNHLNDPKATKAHDYAISNWLKVHKMLKDGTLPPEVVMHATLFSQLSPNTPVPMQELMYAHLVDSMRRHGIDARSPLFASLERDWRGRDSPTVLPETGRSFFEGTSKNRLKRKAKTSGRKAGELGAFMLAGNKFKQMSKYHDLHNSLVDLFNRHRGDVRSAVAELMAHKHKGALWEARRRRHLKKGVDIGPYTEGPYVPGLAPKTARYMAGMIGGGNVQVPDTHFVRYLFGLENGVDTKSIDYLKGVLWDPNNGHVLDGIDRYFAQHHPAVQHMMDHPVFGKHFSNREDAIFPAFWKAWSAVAPHEKFRGLKNKNAYNEGTDHGPFWEAIEPYTKSEAASADLPMRTARVHADWVKKYGEAPAMMLYYMHLVPQLLRASRHNEEIIVKMNRIADNLRKMAEPQPELPPLPQPQAVKAHEFRGKKVIPGEIKILSGPFKDSVVHFLGGDDSHAYIKPKLDDNDHLSGAVSRISLGDLGKGFNILSHPHEAHEVQYVDGNVHGDPLVNTSHEQKRLVHGIDLNNRSLGSPGDGIADLFHKMTGWYSNLSGQVALVKPDVSEKFDPNDMNLKQFSMPRREVAVHNVARDFFGLGQHVPRTALFKHPVTGEPVSVQQRLKNAYHFENPKNMTSEAGGGMKEAFANVRQNGTIDKLALMDLIMANTDRHRSNYMVTNEAPFLHLIDNGLTFSGIDRTLQPNPPSYWMHEHRLMDGSGSLFWGNRQLHPEAVDWALKLDPAAFAKSLSANGLPQHMTEKVVNRLVKVHSQLLKDKSQGKATKRTDVMNVLPVPSIWR